MEQHKNKISLIQSILSIVLSITIWLVLFISINTPLVHLPDIVQVWSAIIAFSLSIPGAIMAILAKKNNVSEKMSIVRISAIGIIISAIDIMIFVLITPIIVSSTFLNLNIISIEYLSLNFTLGIAIDIILIVKYYRTKPIIDKKNNL